MMPLALVAAAQAADLLTFLIVVRVVGIASEQNPLARALYEGYGPAGVVALKVAALVAIIAIAYRLRHRRRLLLILACVGVAAALLNLSAVLT